MSMSNRKYIILYILIMSSIGLLVGFGIGYMQKQYYNDGFRSGVMWSERERMRNDYRASRAIDSIIINK